jgi:hypothetical protein
LYSPDCFVLRKEGEGGNDDEKAMRKITPREV